MDRRWNFLFIIPLAAAFVAFIVTNHLLYTAAAFVIGYIAMEGLRFLLLPPHLHRAVQNYQRGNLQEALELAQRSIQARPERWESHYLLALIYFAKSDLTRAEESARKAIELNPDNDVNRATLGQALYAQRRFSEAQEAFAQAVQLKGKEGLNQYNLGSTLFRLERYDEALPRLELATRLGLDDPQLSLLAHYYLGMCLQKEGDEHGAHEAFTGMQEYAEALETLKRDVETAPGYPAQPLLKEDVAAIRRQLRSSDWDAGHLE